MHCGSSFLVCPCPMCSFTTYSLLIHAHPSMFLRFAVSDLGNNSLASNMHANPSSSLDLWSLKSKAEEQPYHKRFRLVSQAVFILKHCKISVCAQAYLLSVLSFASKIYKVSLDQNVMLYLATAWARNWHFVHFILKNGIYSKSLCDTVRCLENKWVGKSSFNLSLDGSTDRKF